MADAAGLTDEGRLRVAAHFLLSSPPGQIAEVERDVLAIAGALPEAALDSAWRKYSIDASVPLRIQDSAAAVLATEDGFVAKDILIDTNGKQLLRVHHRLQAAEPAGDATSADSVAALAAAFGTASEPVRAAVAAATRKHVFSCYNPTNAGSTPWAKGSEVFVAADGGKLRIYTSCVVRNVSNFWAGGWRTRVEISLGSGPATLSGEIQVLSHYFESGNVQLHDTRPLAPTALPAVPAADDAAGLAAFAAAVVRTIAAAEDGLQSSLDVMYDMLSGSVLKELRRFLPVSGTKMNWHVADSRLRRTLQQQAGSGTVAAKVGK